MAEIKFTKDQQNAIDAILPFLKEPFNPNKHIIGLTGRGGTGKSFLTNYLLNSCGYNFNMIKCASTTHKACRVLSSALNGKPVDTIQSTFGLRLNLNLEDFDPNNPQFDPLGTPKLDHTKILVIDEVSMLPVKLMTYIYNLTKKSKIKVLAIGDDYQLSPVKEKKSTAFSRCFKILQLNQVVRQSTVNPINNLLKMLIGDIEKNGLNFINYLHNHIGICNYNENNEGFTICNRSTFKDIINKSFTNEEYTKDINMYRIIAYTNDRVIEWNNYVRNLIIRNADKDIITKNDLIMSYETIVDEFMNPIITNSEEYIIHDIVNYVDGEYGFNGYGVKFQKIYGGNITKPLFIINHKDPITLTKYNKVMAKLLYDARNAIGAVRSRRWAEYFKFKKQYLLATDIIDKYNTKLYDRDIDYAFAITSHKSQGSTYNTVFVDANNMIFNNSKKIYNNIPELLRRLYVACSRPSKELIILYDKP